MANNAAIEADVSRVVSRAWSDRAFKARLLADANEALASMGIKVPAGLTIRVVEDTPEVRNYVLPLPQSAELSDEHLESVAGGIIIVGGVNRMQQLQK